MELAMRTLTIKLEHLPFRELSPNSRVHWAVKARAVRAAREEVGWLAKDKWQGQEPLNYARVTYEFYTLQKRRRDIDNLVASMKSSLDGLVDAGVLVSDDSTHLELGRCNVKQGDADQTIIIVEEIVEVLK